MFALVAPVRATYPSSAIRKTPGPIRAIAHVPTTIATAQTNVTKAQAALSLAQQTVARDNQLLAQGYIAASQADTDKSTAIAAQSARLHEHERQFVEDMVRWCVHGGTPTEKQAKWLRSIYVRVRR